MSGAGQQIRGTIILQLFRGLRANFGKKNYGREWYVFVRAEEMSRDKYPYTAGLTGQRWRELHGDSWWIYENYASRAVRDGWSALDLFGVFVPRIGWGGLCDRLQGARNLKMAGPKAIWSRLGVADSFCIGAGDALAASGLVLIWQLPREGANNAAGWF